MTAIALVVLFGTLYPLFTEALGFKVSIGPPYFNPYGAIFALPLATFMLQAVQHYVAKLRT